jgi:hypothetical protein
MAKFDLTRYALALMQFGPSAVVGNQWISLGSIERIIAGESELVLVFKSGETMQLDEEDSEQFHKQLIAGAAQIEDQMRHAQAQQAQAMGKALGIIKGN